MRWRDIPNIISLIRIGLVLPIVMLLVEERYGAALILLFVAGASDALDGYLAKRNGWTSRVGSILDPVADKLLLVSAFLVLGWMGHIPLWLVAGIVARDVVILLGASAYHLLVGHYELAPSWISKINTFAQILLGLSVVLSLAVANLSDAFIEGLVYLVATTTILSGVDYVWTWGRRAWHAKSGRHV